MSSSSNNESSGVDFVPAKESSSVSSISEEELTPPRRSTRNAPRTARYMDSTDVPTQSSPSAAAAATTTSIRKKKVVPASKVERVEDPRNPLPPSPPTLAERATKGSFSSDEGTIQSNEYNVQAVSLVDGKLVRRTSPRIAQLRQSPVYKKLPSSPRPSKERRGGKPDGMTRIGVRFQATVPLKRQKYKVLQKDLIPPMEQLWDPVQAENAEARGENIDGFLKVDQNSLLTMERKMKLLHSCGYNVKAAQAAYEQFVQAIETGDDAPHEQLTKSQQRKFKRMLVNGKGVPAAASSSKHFDFIARHMQVSRNTLLQYYYNWKATDRRNYQVSKKEWRSDSCAKCGDGGNLILCELCSKAFHLRCAGLRRVPGGDWFCDGCMKMPAATREAKVKELRANASILASPSPRRKRRAEAKEAASDQSRKKSRKVAEAIMEAGEDSRDSGKEKKKRKKKRKSEKSKIDTDLHSAGKDVQEKLTYLKRSSSPLANPRPRPPLRDSNPADLESSVSPLSHKYQQLHSSPRHAFMQYERQPAPGPLQQPSIAKPPPANPGNHVYMQDYNSARPWHSFHYSPYYEREAAPYHTYASSYGDASVKAAIHSITGDNVLRSLLESETHLPMSTLQPSPWLDQHARHVHQSMLHRSATFGIPLDYIPTIQSVTRQPALQQAIFGETQRQYATVGAGRANGGQGGTI